MVVVFVVVAAVVVVVAVAAAVVAVALCSLAICFSLWSLWLFLVCCNNNDKNNGSCSSSSWGSQSCSMVPYLFLYKVAINEQPYHESMLSLVLLW